MFDICFCLVIKLNTHIFPLLWPLLNTAFFTDPRCPPPHCPPFPRPPPPPFPHTQGDPLGGCNVTPAGYFDMTRRLMALSPGGRMVLALEGGYNTR